MPECVGPRTPSHLTAPAVLSKRGSVVGSLIRLRSGGGQLHYVGRVCGSKRTQFYFDCVGRGASEKHRIFAREL